MPTGALPSRFDEDALRDRARRLQSLHIRLLFCEGTRRAWRKNPADTLADFGLQPDAASRIADIESEQFRAECHGRRVIVERTIARAFVATLGLWRGRGSGAGDEKNIPGIGDFLCSDYFYDPGKGLPHNSGAGPGYDLVSKYFYWLKDRFALARASCDIELRTSAYADFAAFLIREYSRPHDPWFDRFKGGLFWPRTPGVPLPVVLLTEKFALLSINSADTAKQLPQIGLVNLDTLEPPGVPDDTLLA